MKKLIFFLALTLWSIMLMGQNSAVDKLFDKYSGREGFTSVFVSKYMFSLFADISSEDDDFGQLVRGLNGIKILVADKTNEGVNFHREIMRELPVNDYKELMVIKEKDKDIKFYVKEVGGRITELLMIVGGKENVLVCIQGDNINLKNISNLSKSMNIDGLENLDKMK